MELIEHNSKTGTKFVGSLALALILGGVFLRSGLGRVIRIDLDVPVSFVMPNTYFAILSGPVLGVQEEVLVLLPVGKNESGRVVGNVLLCGRLRGPALAIKPGA